MRRRVLSLAIGALAVAGVAAALSMTGGGATFPYPMYSKWFNEYHKIHPDTEINYQSQGSGFGIAQVTAGTVDFGASDGPMTAQQLAEFKQKRGFPVLHFPTVLGGVVPTYHIPGVTATLKFTPESLSGIYLGTITKWNDPRIASVNPGVKLPANDIVVIHRSEGSGTTYCFTDYLSRVSPEWKQKVGNSTSVNWPVGLGGKGNEGVAGLIRQRPNSIGYVELIYAIQNHLPYGEMKNAAGVFVQASLATVTAAAAGAAAHMPADFRVSITNAPGKDAYPISTFTWLLVPEKTQDPAKRKVIIDFLHWMLTSGQKMTATLDYAPLPTQVVAQEEKAIQKIQ